MASISRRTFTKLSLAASAFGGCETGFANLSFAQDGETEKVEFSDKDAFDLLVEDAEETGSPVTKEEIDSFWFQDPEASRSKPVWPKEKFAHDYVHTLGIVKSPDEFGVSHDLLNRLARANRFDIRGHSRVLFGLRGCQTVTEESGDWKSTVRVAPAVPDHVTPKCTMGVWDVDNKRIALFSGSTVPVVDHMQSHVKRRKKNGGNVANLLPTGLHRYRVGPHRGNRQPGAFRQQDSLWVVRANKGLMYGLGSEDVSWDDMDGMLPMDNIHAAMLSGRSKPPYFSSAGCQVVVGAYKDRQPTGSWKKFRVAAGLAHPAVYPAQGSPRTTDDGKEFIYLLLTGIEALAASKGNLVKTLRYGSIGAEVKKLQAKLADLGHYSGAKTGILDRKTLGGLLRWKQSKGLPMTAVLSDELARSSLELKL